MIALLRGTVVRKDLSSIVLDVSGVGYLVNVSQPSIANYSVGSQIVVNTVQIFREDAVTLYGFDTLDELELFNLLCSVNGVGPKSALGILNHLGVSGIQQAVSAADDAMFKAVSGIGPKTAKLIVLSLTGKLVIGDSKPSSTVEVNVVTALVNLGYPERLSRQAVKDALASHPESNEAEILKLALGELANTKRIG